MTVSHKNMPDAQRHEPKGISGAASGAVYVADGAGAGSWTNILATVKNSNKVVLVHTIPDVSTAGSYWVPNPIAGDIEKVYLTLETGITGADSTVSFEINGVAVTGGNITVAYTGSVAGTTFSSTPSGNNTVAAGTPIEIITDGASSTASRAVLSIVMDVS